MDGNIIVYNTPFPCANTCPGCYWKDIIKDAPLDIQAGLSILNQKLHADEKATLIISIMSNPLAYAHVEYVLKKTKHLRSNRQTHVQINIEKINYQKLTTIIESESINEVGLSCFPNNTFAVIQYAKTIQTPVSVILTILNENTVQQVSDAIKLLQATKAIHTIYITPLINKEELKTMNICLTHVENLAKLSALYDKIHLSPCIGKMHSPNCHVTPKSYIEITGSNTIHGCPYKLYKECKTILRRNECPKTTCATPEETSSQN